MGVAGRERLYMWLRAVSGEMTWPLWSLKIPGKNPLCLGIRTRRSLPTVSHLDWAPFLWSTGLRPTFGTRPHHQRPSLEAQPDFPVWEKPSLLTPCPASVLTHPNYSAASALRLGPATAWSLLIKASSEREAWEEQREMSGQKEYGGTFTDSKRKIIWLGKCKQR